MSFAGAVDSFAIGINNAGDIVGCWDMGGNGYPTAGFELIGGAYTTLPQYPGQTYTCPTAINNNGDIVGYYLPTNFDSGYGFLLRSGTYTTIQVPGAALTEVYGITDSGEMAGFYCPTVACATGQAKPSGRHFAKFSAGGGAVLCWGRWPLPSWSSPAAPLRNHEPSPYFPAQLTHTYFHYGGFMYNRWRPGKPKTESDFIRLGG
jgi:hypothetical protein